MSRVNSVYPFAKNKFVDDFLLLRRSAVVLDEEKGNQNESSWPAKPVNSLSCQVCEPVKQTKPRTIGRWGLPPGGLLAWFGVFFAIETRTRRQSLEEHWLIGKPPEPKSSLRCSCCARLLGPGRLPKPVRHSSQRASRNMRSQCPLRISLMTVLVKCGRRQDQDTSLSA